MTATMQQEPRLAGYVKFDESVPLQKLEEFLQEIRQLSADPRRWVDLHVRSAGDDGTHYIGFNYVLMDGKKKTHAKAVNRLNQFLGDRLGTKPKREGQKMAVPCGVIYWSISTVLAQA